MEISTITSQPTIDSREIAELTGKRHDHILRDVEAQLGQLDGGVRRFGDTYL